MKCKYKKITPVSLYFNENFLFESKCLKVRLLISSDMTVYERKNVYQNVDKLLTKLNDINFHSRC